MATWAQPFLPFLVLLGRVSAFMAVLPIFGWRALPGRIRVVLALLLTVFVAMLTPPGPVVQQPLGAWAASLLIVGETLCGLALGLAVRLVFAAVEVGGRIASRQMGLALAGTYDPMSGGQSQPMAMFLEIIFVLFFLASSGHHLLLRLIFHSYEVFPVGSIPTLGQMAEGLVVAGSAMLLFGLKLAAPVLAAFLCLSVLLAILARVLPELNVLFLSLPLRVGLGLFMAAAIVPALSTLTDELAQWLQRFLIS